MQTAMTVIIIALAVLCFFLMVVCLWLERCRFDLEIRLEEKQDLLDFFGVDLMDADDEEDAK